MKYKHYLLKKNYFSSSVLENKTIIDLIYKSGNVTYYVFQLEHDRKKDTYRHQLFISYKNPVALTTVETKFEEFIVKEVTVTPEKAADYCKKELNRVNTPVEWGRLFEPEKRTNMEQIFDLIKSGVPNQVIRDKFPSLYMRYFRNFDQIRQELYSEKFEEKFRDLQVTYIYGETGVGKSRSVIDKYKYKNVYRITDLSHPFDMYKAQDVIVFEEFGSDFNFNEMLNYLDGYPMVLPARYYQKTACYTKVFIISNMPLEQQYIDVQEKNLDSFKAFCRRINNIQHFSFVPNTSKSKVIIREYSSPQEYFKQKKLTQYIS